jgi:hypothetical protein
MSLTRSTCPDRHRCREGRRARDEGETVGAIGIAGGKDGTDEKMAEAGIEAWLKMREELV